MSRIIEIRVLTLKPGMRATFHQLYVAQALPLLIKWQMDVVRYGPSLHDDNTYCVIRSFDSLDARQQIEDAYYASDDWRRGPREAMLACIENYVDTVLEVDEIALQGLRG
jgi:hypothetical protein